MQSKARAHPLLPKQSLLVGVVQMCSTDDVEQNVNAALNALNALRGCRLICLPENALFLRMSKENSSTVFDLTEPFWQRFQEFATANKADILIGSVPLKNRRSGKNGKPTNSTIWIQASGEIGPTYDKIHLFDVDVKGAPPVRESDSFAYGESPQMIEIDGWRIGLSICYDVRFAELYSWYAERDAHLILVPAAFLVPTGEAHWHTLLRARAIESQAFVVAAAPSGGHRNVRDERRETFGHSLVVDPWGEVLVDIENRGATEVAVELDPARLTKVREQIPQSTHRRLNSGRAK